MDGGAQQNLRALLTADKRRFLEPEPESEEISADLSASPEISTQLRTDEAPTVKPEPSEADSSLSPGLPSSPGYPAQDDTDEDVDDSVPLDGFSLARHLAWSRNIPPPFLRPPPAFTSVLRSDLFRSSRLDTGDDMRPPPLAPLTTALTMPTLRHLCDYCELALPTSAALEQHVQQQHVERKCFPCGECGKTFGTASRLKQHKNVHQTVKPYGCQVCGRAYTQFSNLCRHRRQSPRCRRLHRCACDSSFSSQAAFHKHVKSCAVAKENPGAPSLQRSVSSSAPAQPYPTTPHSPNDTHHYTRRRLQSSHLGRYFPHFPNSWLFNGAARFGTFNPVEYFSATAAAAPPPKLVIPPKENNFQAHQKVKSTFQAGLKAAHKVPASRVKDDARPLDLSVKSSRSHNATPNRKESFQHSIKSGCRSEAGKCEYSCGTCSCFKHNSVSPPSSPDHAAYSDEELATHCGSRRHCTGKDHSGSSKYSCNFCRKSFPRSANLTRHVRVHADEQPHRCRYCTRRFALSSHLQRHVRSAHCQHVHATCTCHVCLDSMDLGEDSPENADRSPIDEGMSDSFE